MSNSRIIMPEKKVTVTPGAYREIDEIIIDMTGWADGNLDHMKKDHPTYSYGLRFTDSTGLSQTFYSDERKSGGMIDLYRHCNANYNTVFSDFTKVTIICPCEALADRGQNRDRIFTTNLSELCDNAMRAVPFDVVKRNSCKARLESVLDYACHECVCGYTYRPISRDGVFEDSIYSDDFIMNEQILNERRLENPIEDDRYFE